MKNRVPVIKWSNPRSMGDVPSKRSGHSLTTATDGMAYLFGGVSLSTDRNNNRNSSDVDVLDDITNTTNNEASLLEQKIKKRRRARSSPMNDIFRLDLSGGADLYWSKMEPTSANNSLPQPRWQHTANYLESSNNIIIFGGFGVEESSSSAANTTTTIDGTSCRLNDTWLFDCKAETWTPVTSSAVGSSSSSSSCSPWTSFGQPSKTPPPPRGGHASAVVGGGSCLAIFGGYGGDGSRHSRNDLNDLMVFHIPSSQWFPVDTYGTPPPARSGHALLSSVSSDSGRETLFVMGGWCSSQQFDDVHILENDGSILTWSKVETASGPDSWGPRRWNFGAISVKAVPNWKIFVFGGNSGDLDKTRPQGWRQSNMQVLECAPLPSASADATATTKLSWLCPEIEGEAAAPSPRSDTPILYSQDLGKIFLFGGWSGRWHNDIFTCDVADIVGPQYNIFTIKAIDWGQASSPITGGAKLIISGQGFEATSGGSSTALVKFACPKGSIEVTGELKGDGDVICESPDFMQYGPDEPVEVTVKIGPNRFTNNALPFSFFSVTDASQTVAFGPGLLDGVGANNETSFVIQAKDDKSTDRVCGMDKFQIIIRELLDEKSNETATDKSTHHNVQQRDVNALSIIAVTKLKARAMRIRRRLSEQLVSHTVKDCNDGTYIVTFTPPSPGIYRIDVKFDGTFQDGNAGSIRGSPFTMHAISTDDSANANKLWHSDIETFISDLKESASTISKGLEKSVADNDLRSLLTVKEHLRSLVQSKDNTENGIASNQSALLYTKKKTLVLPSLNTLIKDLETAVSAWNATKALVPETLERISNVDKEWREKIRFKVSVPDTSATSYPYLLYVNLIKPVFFYHICLFRWKLMRQKSRPSIPSSRHYHSGLTIVKMKMGPVHLN